jgi:gamma-glutamyltranspeptidase / glutathione hydrolase
MRSIHALPILMLALVGCSVGETRNPAETEAGDVLIPASNRPDVMGTHGAVSSDHPLASAAGMQVLQRGGNAVDAAVTMAAVLAVVRPHMNGIGGDAFVLHYDAASREVTALNGSGRSGGSVTPTFFSETGIDRIPEQGPLSVTVPGAVAAWADILDRFGTISLADALAPAIGYAEEGFPVSTTLRADILAARQILNEPATALYLPGGDAPRVGALLKNPALAGSLRSIATGGPAAFYQGDIGRRIAEFVEAGGGHLRPEDFRNHTSTWTEPIGVDYLGHRVLAFPPNTQGVAQLQQMQMASHFDLTSMGHNSTEYLHTMVEMKKLAFADRDQWLTDPELTEVPVERLLDPAYAEERAATIGPNAAVEVQPGFGPTTTADGSAPVTQGDGDTVYLMVVDRWGNGVSWIQSLFHSFGSGLLEPSTGVVLHNRGSQFRVDPSHPNGFAPGKRPFHTLNPVMVLREGELAMTIGTPGGDGQTQTILQVYNNLFLFGMTPQQAIEAARYRSDPGVGLLVDDRIPPSVRAALGARGHDITVNPGWSSALGGAQMIYRDPESRALLTGADPRREAYAIAY